MTLPSFYLANGKIQFFGIKVDGKPTLTDLEHAVKSKLDQEDRREFSNRSFSLRGDSFDGILGKAAHLGFSSEHPNTQIYCVFAAEFAMRILDEPSLNLNGEDMSIELVNGEKVKLIKFWEGELPDGSSAAFLTVIDCPRT